MDNQRQPIKDQNRYMSNHDIDGAQPKQLKFTKGKKQANFFDDKQLNDYYHKQKHQLGENNIMHDVEGSEKQST